MRIQHVIGLIVVLLGIASVAFWRWNGGSLKNEKTSIGGTAILECPAVIDLGEQERGQVVVARVPLTNTGAVDLEITGIRTSCACTGLEIEENGKFSRVTELKIRPGETRQLTARWAVNGAAGERISTSIYFTTNAPDQQEVHLQLLVPRLKGGVEVFPAAVTYGRVVVGRTLREVVAVIDLSPTPRVPTRITTSGGRVTATIRPTDPAPWQGPGGGTLVGHVEVVADTSSPGEISENVTVWFGGGQPMNPVSFLVSGRVVNPVEISPGAILLPRKSDAGPLYTATCLARSADNVPFQIRVESCPPGWQATIRDSHTAASKAIEITYHKERTGTPSPDASAIRLVATLDGMVVKLQIDVQVHEPE